MKNKLYFVSILTLFLVSLTFIILNAVKHTKELKEKQKNVNELNTKISTLENSYEEKASEYNELKIKYDELSSENEQLVILVKELQTEEVVEETTAEIQEITEAPAPQKQVESTTEAQTPKEENTTTETIKEEPTETKEELTTEQSEDIPDECGDTTLQYSAKYDTNANRLTRSNGVVYYNGHKETWYSTNESCGATTAVSIPGKHIADDGTIRDADGYICVASSDLSFYTIVDTTLGPAKVYDTGCSHGTIDVYTNW